MLEYDNLPYQGKKGEKNNGTKKDISWNRWIKSQRNIK